MQTASAVKQKISQYWDKSATTYDNSYGHGLKSDLEKELWLDLLARNIQLPHGAEILDVGCGTGFLSLLLAELGFKVTGLDLSEEMRHQAKAKAGHAGFDIRFMSGDAEAPPFPERSFDAVISRHVAWTLPDPQSALVNWGKLIRPGGSVIIIDGVWTPRCLGSFLRFLAADGVRLLQGKLGHLLWARKYARKSDLPLYGGAEPEKVMKLVEETGFSRGWIDRMEPILTHERRNGPLEYRISYGKNRRYLIGGIR